MSYSEIPDKEQAALLARYQPMRGWPASLDGYPLKQALRLARRQQDPRIITRQTHYERVLQVKVDAPEWVQR